MEKVNLALLLVTILFSSASATNPGFVLRVNEKGLEYAKDNIMTMFVEKLKNINPKELSGKICLRLFVYLKYKATGIKNTEFSVSSASLETVRGRGISLSASGVDFSYTGDWSFFFRYNWRTFRDRGTFKMSGKKARFSFMIEVGERDGRPTISDLSCKGKIGSLDVKLFKKSRPRILYNYILRMFGYIIKPKVLSMFCDGVTKTLKEDLEKELSLIPMNQTINKHLVFDFSLLEPPCFGDSFVEINMKGEMVSTTNPKESSLKPTVIPEESKNCDNMMCIFVTDYVLNTAAEVYFNDNVFNVTLNGSTIDPKNKSVVNPQLSYFLNFEELYQDSSNSISNSSAFVHAYCTKPPSFETHVNGTTLKISGNADFFMKNESGVSLLFSLEVNLTARGMLNVTANKIHGNISEFDVHSRVIKSFIGELKFDIAVLNILLHLAAEKVFIAPLNKYLAKGISLPPMGPTQLENTVTKSNEKFLLVDTDLKYSGLMQQEHKRWTSPPRLSLRELVKIVLEKFKLRDM